MEWWEEKKKITKIFAHEYGKISFVVLCTLVGIGAVFLVASLVSPHKLVVTFLDVGQGDAILVQTPSGHTMLIDGGPTNKILERLSNKMSYFDSDIDVIVATHPDADHVTGLIPVLEKYTVQRVVESPVEGHTGVLMIWKNIFIMKEVRFTLRVQVMQ